MNTFDRQPSNLANAVVQLAPLKADDFERLYAVANDPLLWAQHPNPDRYQRAVFSTYFEGAMASGGAFLVTDAVTGDVIGCSRFYDFDPEASLVLIGYTFIARSHWGSVTNQGLKKLMLDYAFGFVERVQFHVGAQNIRSQKAMAKLGARKVAEFEVAYYGEPLKLNFVYEISKGEWIG
jgi:RimJ/RimL family protein N-acetyltransferase